MTIHELSVRLEAVERENRRMKAGGAFLLVLALGVVAMGQGKTAPGVVQAERFEVVGDDGRVTATLGSIRPSRGTAVVGPASSLVFYDAADRPRILLDQARDGASGLLFLDEGRHPRAAFLSAPDGSPSLHLSDATGKARAALDLGKSGSVGLHLSDDGGTTRMALDVRKDGSPRINLLDGKGRNGMTLAIEPGGAEGFSLWDTETGKPRVAIFVDAEAAGAAAGMALYDRKVRDRADFLLLKDGTPRLALSDAEGKELFLQPK